MNRFILFILSKYCKLCLVCAIVKYMTDIRGYGHFFHKQVFVILWRRECFQIFFHVLDLPAH